MSKRDTANPSGKHISEEVLVLIEQSIKDISFGSITLVLQDSRVIQIEKLEKIRIYEQSSKVKPAAVLPETALRTRIIQAVNAMEYGKVVIQIQAGHITQVERTEKYRVEKLTGLYGDGI